jgi:hypothetical protein
VAAAADAALENRVDLARPGREITAAKASGQAMAATQTTETTVTVVVVVVQAVLDNQDLLEADFLLVQELLAEQVLEPLMVLPALQ